MNDSSFVCCRKPTDDLLRIVRNFPDWNGTLIQTFTQLFALQQFGNYERSAFVFTNVINSKDVWMIKCRCSLRLLLKTSKSIRVVRKIRRQEFYRYFAIKSGIVSAVDFTHSASAKFRNDAIVGDRSVRQEISHYSGRFIRFNKSLKRGSGGRLSKTVSVFNSVIKNARS